MYATLAAGRVSKSRRDTDRLPWLFAAFLRCFEAFFGKKGCNSGLETRLWQEESCCGLESPSPENGILSS
jgi:hypothetical protein